VIGAALIRAIKSPGAIRTADFTQQSPRHRSATYAHQARHDIFIKRAAHDAAPRGEIRLADRQFLPRAAAIAAAQKSWPGACDVKASAARCVFAASA
jgi:hypothetical protein